MLIFIGQTMASAANSYTNNVSHETKDVSVEVTDDTDCHSLNRQVNGLDTKIDSNSCDCCYAYCYCPMGSCVSITLPSMQNHDEPAYQSIKTVEPSFMTISQIFPALLRPPISLS